MDQLVTYTLDGPTATIGMDDGKVNALSPRMLAEIGAAFDRARDDEASVVVLTGRPGTFSAGFDLKVMRSDVAAALDMIIAGFRLAEKILSFPKPVVMACTGHAIAMGSFLLLSGDHRIGTAGEFRLVANEVAIGLTIPLSAVEICRQRLTPAAFNRAIILSETFTPESAVDAGFLDQVVPAEHLTEATHEAAARFAALNAEAHANSKLRVRHKALEALAAAIEKDEAQFRAFLG